MRGKHISLKIKATLLIATVAVLLSIVSIAFYNRALQVFVTEHYCDRVVDLAQTTAVSVDAKRVHNMRDKTLAIYETATDKTSNESWGTPEHEQYAKQFEHLTELEDYKVLVQQLREVQDQNIAECIYIIWPDVENSVVVYLADGSYEDICTPGMFDPFTEHDYEVIEHPEEGFTPDITYTSWGWTVAAGAPIYDGDEIAGYATVDFSMDEIMAEQSRFLLAVIGAIVVVTIILALIGAYLVNRLLVAPIEVLTKTASEFITEDMGNTHRGFAALEIHTHDEIETLANAMTHMELEINEYIRNLTYTTEELIHTRERAKMMNEVATHDVMTKTLNKRAYTTQIGMLDDQISAAIEGEGEWPSFGIVMIDANNLKSINDTYGHDKGDQVIIGLANMILSVFDSDCVYRIGGDEFVVLLRGERIAEADGLVCKLNKIMKARQSDESAEPWERVSAAVGYASYQPGEDEETRVVLRRADKNMYGRKAAMKLQGDDEASPKER